MLAAFDIRRVYGAAGHPAGPYDRSVAETLVEVRLPWPAPSLPGVCARTGVPTLAGLVLTPAGAPYAGAEVIVPLSPAARIRVRALTRIAVLAALLAAAFAVCGFVAAFLLVPAVMSALIAAIAAREARRGRVLAQVRDRELILRRVHPAFAAAVAAQPARCGSKDPAVGCTLCRSGCLPQVALV